MSVPVNSATTNYYDYTVVYNYYTRTVTIEDASSYVGAGVGSQSYTLTLPSGTVLTGTITPSAPVPLVFNMGYMGASIQVGNYDIVGVFTDADDEEYTLEKETNLCLPKQNSSSTGANGCVTLGWTVRCIDNLIIVADQTPFVLTVNSVVYQATDVTYGITCVNPLGVILANNVDIPSFQITPIVNGGYNININDTATFEVGDNVSVIVHFVLLGTIKKAQCNINLCDVYCAVDAVYRQWLAIQGTGSPQERTLKDKWVQLAFLIGEAQIAITCGNDLNAILEQIEAISGVACACGCGVSNVNQGVNVALGQNIVIQGGDNITVESSTVGNTTTFTVNGYAYDIVSDTLTVTSSTTGNTTTYRLEESGKVKADSTDTAAGYLYNKLESSDGSITITDDTSGTHQVDLTVTTPDWIALTYSTNFANFGGSTQTGRYRKWANGRVEIEGRVTASVYPASTAVTTLPSGYRPTLTMQFPVNVNNSGNYYPGEIQILSTGATTLLANSAGWTGTVGYFSFNVEFYVT